MRVRARRAGLRAATLALASALAVSGAGCSTSDESAVPVACVEGADAIERALRSAPEPVTVNGVPLSDCFTQSSDPADVQAIGFAFTDVATRLARRAREQPEGEAATDLGYLVGAVRSGAQGTQGIHDELVRRLEQELAGVDTGSAAYRAGERAGRESG